MIWGTHGEHYSLPDGGKRKKRTPSSQVVAFLLDVINSFQPILTCVSILIKNLDTLNT